MKVVAAYLLAKLGGHLVPKKEDLKAILASVGADSDDVDVQIEYLLKQVEGKPLHELIEVGQKRMANFNFLAAPAGGAVSAAAPTGSGADSGAALATEAKKEEKKEEVKEESDDEEALFNLFE